jgi:hypothetical protein
MPSITMQELLEELKLRGFEGFSQTELTRYVDWAWREVLRKTNWEFEHRISEVAVSPPDYQIGWDEPAFFKDLIRLMEVTEDARKELSPISEEEFYSDWAAIDFPSAERRGDPTEYFNHFDKNIYLLPPPDSARTYRIYHWQYVGTGEQALAEGMLEGWDEILLCGAEARGHYRARQPEFGQIAEAKFNELIIERFVQQEMRNENLPERVYAPWSRVR